VSETSPHAKLVGKILDRIVELSQFEYDHDGWWTLQKLMGDHQPQGDNEEDESCEEGVEELFALIADDPIAVAVLDLSYQKMKTNNGNLPKEG
jgi:hypothetical protein